MTYKEAEAAGRPKPKTRPQDIRVLVACEESGAVSGAFLKRGFDAWSLDIKPTTGEHPERHIQADAVEYITRTLKEWDLIIAHPPCTYLALSGNRWLKDNPERQRKRAEALDFFAFFLELGARHLAIENPLSQAAQLRPSDQTIHPWQFGEEAEKTTCLWLKGLPPLKPTKIVSKGEFITYESGCKMPKWYAELWNKPKEERATLRAKTFKGIAEAMADQWGEYLLKCGRGEVTEYEQLTLF